MWQKTISQVVSCSGVGVHTGERISLTLRPSAKNSGISFIRTDVTHKNNVVPAKWNYVVDTHHSTTIGNKDSITVGTVEHVMAALHAQGVNNVIVELSGPEVPIMDGSAAPFIFLIECAGIVTQNAQREILHILNQVEVSLGDGRYIGIMPSDGFSLSLDHDFKGRCGRSVEHYEMHDLEGNFKAELARARTFGFYEDAQKLWSSGLAKGGSLSNAVVISEDGVMNPEGLRYDNECVRHKALDVIGDLYLAGHPIQGAVYGKNVGHCLNNKLLQAIFEKKDAWTLTYSPSPEYFQENRPMIAAARVIHSAI